MNLHSIVTGDQMNSNFSWDFMFNNIDPYKKVNILNSHTVLHFYFDNIDK